MFDPNKILKVVAGSFPDASPEQVLAALQKLAKAHPELDEMQALAAIQYWLKQRQGPSMAGGGNPSQPNPNEGNPMGVTR